MKRSLLFSFCLLLLPYCYARAQSLDTTTGREDAEARRIFSLPGPTGLDPDETFEYLDELSTITGDTLERLHAHADVSWHEARVALLRHQSAALLERDSSSAGFWLRSRGSSALDPQAQAGYASGAYLGSSAAVYNRVIAKSSSIEVSALEQKSAWEPSLTDHLTGFAELRNSIPIAGTVSLEKAVAGDYALAFGSGLVFGGGLASSNFLHAASAIEERSFGLRGTVNSSLRNFLGGALELSDATANLFVFASKRSFDASVVNDTIDTVFSTSLHQTESELAHEGAASAAMVGARIELHTSDTANLYVKGGITAYDLNYNYSYRGTIEEPFLGSRVDMAGIDLLALSGGWTGIAEAAMSANDTSRQTAVLLSTIFEPADRVAFSLLYRYIPYRFVSPFGELSGVSASNFTDFEGVYFGIQLAPIPERLRISAYSQIESEFVPVEDLFGKQRHDYMLSTTYRLAPPLELSATVRDQENATVADTETVGYVTLQGQTLNARFEATYRTPTNTSLTTRYERSYTGLASLTQDSSQSGWLLAEEVKIKAPAIQSEFTIVVSRFATTPALSSLWTYESATPGTAVLDPLQGLGWRVSLRASVRPIKPLTCSAYLAGTVYDVPHTIGSGLTAHTGTSDFTATVQIDVQL